MADLFAYLLRSGACLALFYAFYRTVLMKETSLALNRAYLLGAAALSLGLPLVRVTSPFFTTVIPASAFRAPADPSAAFPPPSVSGLHQALLFVYLAGAGACLLLFLIRIARLGLMVARCGCVRNRGLRVVLCGYPGESFSFFNFVFLNKADIPDGDVDRILAHELAHVRQLHSLDIVFSELLTVVQWFNPFVWPYKRSLRETHEYLADRAVIAQGCSLARYQLLIVEQHVGGRLLELASSFRTSQIKRRIIMLTKQETKGLSRWKPLLILPLALAFVLAFAESRTVVRAEPGAALTPAPSGQDSAAKKDVGKPVTLSDEEMAKALLEKALQLEDMKKKNEETMAKLKEKLEATTDPDTKAKILAMMKEQKVMSFEIGAKERSLQMKKLEIALNEETDPAKRTELEHKLQVLHVETEEYMKKGEQLRGAEEKAKQAAEKK
jgi:hypothetical protein